MSGPHAASELPSRLQDVLDAIPGSEDGERFRELFGAAATAIDVLRDLEFPELENDEFASSEEIWSVMGPALESTTEGVDEFLAQVRRLFGSAPAEDPGADEEWVWFEQVRMEGGASSGAEGEPAGQVEEVGALLRAIGEGLGRELARFRSSIAGLREHPDRWLVLDHIAMFRGKVRSGIGTMVYRAAGLFLDVEREEVVPAYHDDVQDAVTLRRELGALREEVRMYRSAVEATEEPGDLKRLVEGVATEVHRFLDAPVYRLVRAADKRPFGKARRDLRALSESEPLVQAGVLTFMEGLTRFLESLASINAREILILHDAAELGHVRDRLAGARTAAESRHPEEARTQLREALSGCGQLLGRDEHLDDLYRSFACLSLDALGSLQLASLIRRVEAAL